jgi:uncharacterized Zn finger protein
MTTESTAPTCGVCHGQSVQHLDALSHRAYVDYYRCPDCGHVWTAPKAGTPGELRDITIRETKNASERRCTMNSLAASNASGVSIERSGFVDAEWPV